jgi:archaellum component FlaG (FlaF/FlaG flagellin family)
MEESILASCVGRKYVSCCAIALIDPDGEDISLSPGDVITVDRMYEDPEGKFAVIKCDKWSGKEAYLDYDFFSSYTWVDEATVKKTGK